MRVCSRYPCYQTAAGCSVCDVTPGMQAPWGPPVIPTMQPMGCICPPTSEKTCEAPMCPRKSFKISAAGAVTKEDRK